jgi:hypothetical protein
MISESIKIEIYFLLSSKKNKDEASFYQYQDKIEQMNLFIKDLQNFNNEVFLKSHLPF